MNGRNHKRSPDLLLFLVLTAVLVLLSFIPFLGPDPIGITFVQIPVLTASLCLGPAAGGLMGAVWTVISAIRDGLNPSKEISAGTLLLCMPAVVCGLSAGWIQKALKRTRLRSGFRAFVSSSAGMIIYSILLLAASGTLSSSVGDVDAFSFWINRLFETFAAVAAVPVLLFLIRRKKTVLGIDMGGSSTKLALVQNGKCVSTLHLEKEGDIADAVERIGTKGISRIALTGVGSAAVTGDLCGIPTDHVEEFRALANGAAFCSGKQNFLCVSIGTGTSFVRVTPLEFRHFGGSGMGGGTLRALSKGLCGTEDMEDFRRFAVLGDLSGADLQLKDICEGEVPDLLPTSTVSNLGKTGSGTSKEDLAAGICNLIFESIGVMAACSVKSCLTRTIVMTGTITEWHVAKRSLDEVAFLHHVKFIVPEHSKYAGAIGAALTE